MMTVNKHTTLSIFKKYFFTPLIVLLSIALNFSGSRLAGLFAFPLYMDSVATIGCAALCGFLPALIVAVASNLLLYLFSSTALPFMLCHISTAVFASLIFSASRKRNDGCLTIESFLWAGLVTAFTNAALGDTFSLILFYGNTSIPQVDNAVQGIMVATGNMPFAVYWGGTVTNIIDKIISSLFGLAVHTILRKKNIRFDSEDYNKVFRIEYILLILAAINLFSTFSFKKHTEIKTGNCYKMLLETMKQSDLPDVGAVSKLNDTLYAYSYFNNDIQSEISELEFANKTAVCAKLQIMIFDDHARLLFGFDSLTISSFFLIFIIVIMLIQKNENIRRQFYHNQIVQSEQQKLSRNLHDSALQNLAALELQIQNDNKEKSMQFVKAAVQDLRYLCGILKVDTETDFIILAREKLEIFSSSYGVRTEFYCASKNVLSFDTEKRNELGFIYQELLSNIARHAQATSVTVKMLDVGSEFILNITDNGIGFDRAVVSTEKIHHLGLANVEKRVLSLGGTVDWKRAENGGTMVVVQI